MKRSNWPKKVTVGSVTVRIYRYSHPRTKTGFIFHVTWHVGPVRKVQKFSEEREALLQARLRADRLAAGEHEAAHLRRSDVAELAAARELAGSVPLIAALEEWRQARSLAGGQLIAAATEWKRQHGGNAERITIAKAVDGFIEEKEKAGKQGERTYRAKLKPFVEALGERGIAEVSAAELAQVLERFQDPVTRNDIRKRGIALWRWAQRRRFIPLGANREIELTERAAEFVRPIQVTSAENYRNLLRVVRDQAPELLAATVLAGLAGLRAAEIHGKRSDQSERQVWEDVFLDGDSPHLKVTAAKRNTPPRRSVPLRPAAIAWLKLVREKSGPVAPPLAMERVRRLARENKIKLSENVLRHSFITYLIDFAKSKSQAALEAGTSEQQIEAHYRARIQPDIGKQWFEIFPD